MIRLQSAEQVAQVEMVDDKMCRADYAEEIKFMNVFCAARPAQENCHDEVVKKCMQGRGSQNKFAVISEGVFQLVISIIIVGY